MAAAAGEAAGEAEKILKCVLCGKPMGNKEEKHNPAPVKESGFCCSKCNRERVIP